MAQKPTKNDAPQGGVTESAPVTNAPKNWKSLASEAAKGPTIFPKLQFEDNGRYNVEFLEAEPRQIEFEDEFTRDDAGNKIKVKGYAINALNLDTGDGCSILMRGDPSHGLTRGIGQIFSRVGTLLGVRCRITVSSYHNAKYDKETRSYAVVRLAEVVPEGSVSPP